MSQDSSALLSLPYILPAQAQKHVTHNEALRVLDLLVQLAVSSRQLADPPGMPAQGDRYIVPPGATGVFSGHVGQIALWQDSDWQFVTPRPGWQAEVLDEATRVVFDGTDWVGPEARFHRVSGLGVATDADATNRLAVAAPATLLTHDGGGHQLKINKAMATDTASLLFQTGWSGRAEMGTAGSDAFEIKTSADGSTFQTALRAVSATGGLELPSGCAIAPGSAAAPGLTFLGAADTGLFSPGADEIGLSAGGQARVTLTPTALDLSVPITGTAVTQAADDSTPGRLMKTGDGGILGGAVSLEGSTPLQDQSLGGGIYQYAASAIPGGPESAAWFHTMFMANLRAGTDRRAAFDIRTTGSNSLRAWVGATSSATGAFFWDQLVTARTLIGTVGQSGGIPTGAVIERGSNANGDYTRFADGTQICTVTDFNLGSIKGAGAGTFADPYRTDAPATITWPAAFTASPAVSHTLRLGGDAAVQAAARALLLQVAVSPSLTGWVSLRAQRVSGDAIDRNALLSVIAIGRWF